MHDQANHLRRLVGRRDSDARDAEAARPKLVLVTSGSGGTGTTTIAVNLTVALARRGYRSVLVDADPHGGNVAMLCGLQDRFTIADVLSGRRTVGEALQTGPGGVQVLPGAWAIGNLAECPAADHARLVSQLERLDEVADVIVVDTADGTNRLLRRLCLAAADVVFVTTPEPASVLDAYGSIKMLSEGDDSIRIHSLVNMAPTTPAAGGVHLRLAQACSRLLGIDLNRLGHIEADPLIATAGKAGEPFVLAAPGSQSTRRMHGFARKLAPRAAAIADVSPAAKHEVSSRS